MLLRLLRLTGIFATSALNALCCLPAAYASPTHHFVVFLTASDDGFEMRCPEGCGAPRGLLRLSCGPKEPCHGELFDQGVRGVRPDGTAIDEPPAGSKFDFLVTRTEKGVELRSRLGCGWKTLWYACGAPGPCRVRVDERGIRKALPEELAP